MQTCSLKHCSRLPSALCDLQCAEPGCVAQTLELRVNPPNINILNPEGSSITHVTVDSANRPGTLVEVILCSLATLTSHAAEPLLQQLSSQI